MNETLRLASYRAAALQANGVITSNAIATATGINPTMVRRDLSVIIGSIGRRGFGYKPDVLISSIEKELDGKWPGIDETAKRERNVLEQIIQSVPNG